MEPLGTVFVAAVLAAASSRAAAITVTTTNDSRPGSLREAIDASNLSTGVLDPITFNIGGPGSTIIPSNALPGGVDAFPDGKVKDNGCDGKNPDGTLGANVKTNVVVKDRKSVV